AVPALLRGMFMSGRGANIFQECRAALLWIGEPAVQPLIEVMQRKNSQIEADAKKYEFIPGIVVQKASIGLGELGSKKAVPALLEELKKPDEGLTKSGGVSGHQSVLLALGLIGDKAAYAPLIATLNDAKAKPKLRVAAADALNVLGDEAALPSLVKV